MRARHFAPLLLLAPARAAADEITFVDGRVVTDVVVFEETWKEVKWRKPPSRSETVRPAADVLRVLHTNTVEEWTEATKARDEGDYAAAAALFRQSTENPRAEREEFRWLKAYGPFHAAEALRFGGKPEEAIAAYDAFLKAFPDSRLAPEAQLRRALVLRQKGSVEEARAALQKLVEEATAKGMAPRWKFEAALDLLLLDDTLAPEKRRGELMRLHEAALGKSPTVASRCRVEVGYSFIAEQRFQEARDHFDRIVREAGAELETLAGAFLGRGDCSFLNAGKFSADANADYRQALDDYLRVIVLYKDRRAYVGKALLFAGKCFDLLRGDRALERARQLWRRCQREFPGTPWAREAGELLRK